MIDPAQNKVNKITVGKAAKMLGMSSSSVRRLEEADRINSQRDENNYRYYLLEDVLKLKETLEAEKLEAKQAQLEKITANQHQEEIFDPTVTQTATPKVASDVTTTPAIKKLGLKTQITKEEDPFYTNFKKHINLISAGFVMASLMLMLFSGIMLTPPKAKSHIYKNITNVLDRTGARLASALNIEIQQIEPFTQKKEKEMLASVLGVRNRNPQYQVEFNVPVIARNTLTVEGAFNANGSAQFNNGLTTNTLTFVSPGQINNLLALDDTSKASLEDILELSGDATGTLSNITIEELAGLSIGDIDDSDGNLLFVDGGEIVGGTLADLDTTEITELGTIKTGTWEADVISPEYGGTGMSSFASVLLHGGNSFGEIAKIGTTDTYGLSLMTNNIDRLL
ncbi:MAG TPA: MerR family transcriptional regulator, partial [candidate division WWE3 bacterium]|nr:MerR family transcriptional regulator [candidate division WWE3 bacterium]